MEQDRGKTKTCGYCVARHAFVAIVFTVNSMGVAYAADMVEPVQQVYHGLVTVADNSDPDILTSTEKQAITLSNRNNDDDVEKPPLSKDEPDSEGYFSQGSDTSSGNSPHNGMNPNAVEFCPAGASSCHDAQATDFYHQGSGHANPPDFCPAMPSTSTSTSTSHCHPQSSYWDDTSIQHVFWGNSQGEGGHLWMGTLWPGKTYFPQHWTLQFVKNLADQVINDPKTPWRDSHHGYMTTVLHVDGARVKLVYDPLRQRIVTMYPMPTVGVGIGWGAPDSWK